METASLAAITMISAHETTPGQIASSTRLAESIIPYPRTVRFGIAVFSLLLPSRRIDASHPFNQTNIFNECIVVYYNIYIYPLETQILYVINNH